MCTNHVKPDFTKLQLTKQRLVKVCRLLYRKRLVAGSQGNISCRVSDVVFLIKHTGVSFKSIRPENFVLMDNNGRSLTQGEPSIEKFMHLKIYENRPDINFVIHTHPPQVIKLSRELQGPLKFSSAIGELSVVDYFPPGSLELADAVAEALKDQLRKAVVLKDHGLVTVGSTLKDAYDLTLLVEGTVSNLRREDL
ncbi:MAG: class II aldolase/adducin family protein [Thermoproteota archaeon]|nr:class II aldolase/adducin family protein [Thermoproteota archaeon]